MLLVVDTNVVVSGLLQARGPSGQIVRWLANGALTLAFDARILIEYREVLGRPKFRFDPELVGEFLDHLERTGLSTAPAPLRTHLADPDDEPFLEVALAAKVPFLVTGNQRHFPKQMEGVQIVSPRELVEVFRSNFLSPSPSGE